MTLSRREFLALAVGGAGSVIACACGGLGIGALLIANRRKDQPVVQSAPLPTQTPTDEPPPFPIISKAEWGGLAPNHEAEFEKGFFSADNNEGWRVYEGDLREVYTTVVIHHSVVYEQDDLNTMLEIQRLHREDRGWADIGYHYLIGKEGAIYAARPMDVRGVHVAGYNTGSIGVCLLGNFMETLPTPLQIQAANAIVQWLKTRLSLDYLAGHRQFNTETLCPGDNMIPYLTEFASNAGLIVSSSGIPTPTPTPTLTSFCTCHL